jgi:hypothetical protein
MLISLSRVIERAMRRFATLMQATSRTQPAAPNKISRAG